MGVMNQMRANMKLVLGFLVVVFVATMSIGGLVGGADITDLISGKKPNAFTVVNGEEISYEQYMRAVDRERESYRERSGQEPTDQQMNQLRDQVWDALVTQVLIRQQVENLGLTATQEEITYYGTENIHPVIRQYFSDEAGNFDSEQYQAALQSPEAANFFLAMENQLRSVIPIEKLQRQIFATANVSEAELREIFAQQTIPYSVEYIFIRNTLWDDEAAQPTDAEIANYYDTHAEDYQQAESRVLQYAAQPLTPTNLDSQLTFDRLVELKHQIRDGRRFEEVAQLNSDDPSGSNGGSLGWFGKGRMVPPFEEAAFSAKKGELVGPVLTRFGYHLIRVDSSRNSGEKKEVLASHILMRITPSQSTREAVRQQLFQLKFLAEEISFQAAADSLGMQINETTPLKLSDTFITGLGAFQPAISFAFRNTVGTISDVLSTDTHMGLFRLESIVPPGPRPLDEVKASIKRKLINDKKMVLAKALADSIYSAIGDDSDLKTLAESRTGLTHQKPASLTADKALPGVGNFPKVWGALRAAEPSTVLPPQEVSRGYVILKLNSRGAFDPVKYNAMRKSLYEKALEARQNAAWTNFLAGLKEEAEIIDNRVKFL
ncbi:MAG: SurA N-terminal domain-containing protein [Lentisphaeria bacterium]|nr:SurA N-terminal domain-containing protein [Candidatus Neomarinimicrobiota bacterium]MCF7842217.1 SurA N-terminal domain-containing protein [Lentisphaeria bacterium]